MKKLMTLIAVCFLVAAVTQGGDSLPGSLSDFGRDGENEGGAIEAPRVIIDTDLGSSVDDLFALDFAARMHKAGKLDLLAVMMNRPDRCDPAGEGQFLDFADRYLNSLGLDMEFPLGRSEALSDPNSHPEVINPYWSLVHSNEVTSAWFKASGRDLDTVTNAVALYRQLLNDAPERSVVICSIGFFNNLRALMDSAGDASCGLSGKELVASKVKELRIMGGCFDGSVERDRDGKGEYNVEGDIPSATKIFAEWPTPIVVTPWEVGMKLEYRPEDVLADFPVGTPSPTIRAVYERWPNPPEGFVDRQWDPMTVFPLAEGDAFAPLSELGGVAVDAQGRTMFVADPSSNRCYQVASNMVETTVMERFRAVFRTGNPSVTLLEGGTPVPGVDYNGSEMVFEFANIQFGSYAEWDLQVVFEVDGAEFWPESSEWDETLGVQSVRFAIPPDVVTAGNIYDGTLTVALDNDEFGSVQLMTASRRLVQGVIEGEEVNSYLARIDGGDEYATVADAVGAADGNPIQLLHAASWRPSVEDIGKPVRFLNRSSLVLDESHLPANARAVWTDEVGTSATLTLELVFADTVVYGTIRTAEEDDPVVEAIAIKDGRYVCVGYEDEVATFVKDGVTKVVDHRGKGMVMPGCTDGHSHYLNTFAMKNMKGGVLFDIWDDKDAVLQKLSEATQKASDAGKMSLCGFGWNSQIILANKLSRTELDGVTHGVSTVIFDSSGHHAFCNSECLKRSGIIDDKGDVLITEIDGGVLELDKDGYPTGYVNERVTGYLTRMGGIDADELIDDAVAEDAICKAQELLLSTGYTMALDGWSNNLHPRRFYEVAHCMDTNGTLRLVLPMTYEVEPWQTNMTSEIEYLALLNEKYGTRHVLPEYLKVFMDGVVESRTGATTKPYQKDGKDAFVYKSFWAVDRLADITEKCNAKGLTVHTHVMGDAAIRETVDAYIRGGDGTHRNCLVHLRNVSTNDVNDFQRIADNNIACAAGLTWHATDTDFDNILKQFLCDEYVKHAYPMKSFLDAGVRASAHSDYPANIPSPQDPFGMMQVAVTGMIPDPGELDYPFDTDELITVEQAFQMLTLNGAWQMGLENERGSIRVGKWADFVLADQDVFACAPNDIHKTTVVSTWFEGEKVYQAVGPVPVAPGESIVSDTAEEASNVLKRAAFTPSANVAERLGGEGSTALQTYCGMFTLDVVPTLDGKWAVEALLLPEPWTNVALSAQEATRQIPVEEVAAREYGEPLTDVPLTNCVPGFYYSLYDGVAVTNLKANVNPDDCNVLCGPGTTVLIPVLPQPGPASGFFSIGVLEAPSVIPGVTETVTNLPSHKKPGDRRDIL